MSSRRYLPRVWRVYKEGGAVECFGWLLVKALRKHGWPAVFFVDPVENAVVIHHDLQGERYPEDFRAAVDIAVRITARTHRLEVRQSGCHVFLMREYRVHPVSGYFSEVRKNAST